MGSVAEAAAAGVASAVGIKVGSAGLASTAARAAAGSDAEAGLAASSVAATTGVSDGASVRTTSGAEALWAEGAAAVSIGAVSALVAGAAALAGAPAASTDPPPLARAALSWKFPAEAFLDSPNHLRSRWYPSQARFEEGDLFLELRRVTACVACFDLRELGFDFCFFTLDLVELRILFGHFGFERGKLLLQLQISIAEVLNRGLRLRCVKPRLRV